MTRSRDLANLADGTEFSAADHSKLDGIEASATADQTSAQIKAAVEAATDSNVFTDADHSKLDAIEASADQTDTANVTAAGALMDSELTNLAAVKAINQSLVTTASPTFAGLSTTANVGIGDTSPTSLLSISKNSTRTNDFENMLKITHSSSSTTVAGFGSAIYFVGERNNGAMQGMGRLIFDAEVNSGTNISSGFSVQTATAGTPSEKFRITHDGNVKINSGSLDLTAANSYITGSGHNVLQVDNTRTYLYGGTDGVQFRTADNATALVDITNAGHLITKGGVSIDDGSSTGPEFAMERAQNLKVKGASGVDVGITGYNAANAWAFQLYGHATSSYGFLEGNWGAWDIQKFPNGKLILNGNTTYYLQPETTTKLNNVQVGGIDFGTSGASAETLDDYETGSFQMTMVGVSGGARGKGLYVKIGNLVTFQWYSTSSTVVGSSSPVLTGLPFTAIDPINSGAYPTFVSSHNNYVSNSSSGYINLGTTSLYFTTNNSSGGTTTQAGTRYVMVSGSYYAS